MGIITPDRFNNLKARVKAECTRRCYTGSVADYAGTTYDYKNSPAINRIIAKEHIEKLAVPMNAINSIHTPYTSGDRVINNTELTTMETKITVYENIALSSTDTGCSASCTGLCSTGCSGGCSGSCKGSCDGGCDGDCDGDCDGTCIGGCDGTCSGGCDGDCYGSCIGGCDRTCRGSCDGSCSGGCEENCATDCTSSQT